MRGTGRVKRREGRIYGKAKYGHIPTFSVSIEIDKFAGLGWVLIFALDYRQNGARIDMKYRCANFRNPKSIPPTRLIQVGIEIFPLFEMLRAIVYQ